MKTTNANTLVAAVALFAAAALPASLSAQLPNASAVHLGLGGNTTAIARGFQAVGANPAGLAMPGTPRFSLAIPSVMVESGLDPLSLTDILEYDGEIIPASVKSEWLADVRAAGGSAASGGAEVTAFSATLGRIGVQFSTVAFGEGRATPDAMEAAFFGNAGRTGTAQPLDFSGSYGSGFAVSTLGLSYALPLGDDDDRDMALGATLKYSFGNGVGALERVEGLASVNPVVIDATFPAIASDYETGGAFDQGTGIGLDVGFMLQRDRLSLGATVQNLFHTFEWDTEKLYYIPGRARLALGQTDFNIDGADYSLAPASLRAMVEEMQFDPALAVGLGYDVRDELTVVADIKGQLGDDMLQVGPDFHLGAGAEYRGISFLHLRAGGAVVTDGVQFGGGGTLLLGPVRMSSALGYRSGDLADAVLGQFTLSFGGN